MNTDSNSNVNADSNKAYAAYLKRYADAEGRADNILFYDNKSNSYRKALSSNEYYDVWCDRPGDLCA